MFKFLKKGKNGEPDTIAVVETPPITVEDDERYKEDFIKENPGFVPVEDTPAEKADDKKGFFARLADGLQKTRSSINDRIDSVFKAFVKVDEEFFEELGCSFKVDVIDKDKESNAHEVKSPAVVI